MDLIGLLVVVLILAIVFTVVIWILDQFPVIEPFKGIVRAIIGLIAVLVLLGLIFGGVSLPVLRVR